MSVKSLRAVAWSSLLQLALLNIVPGAFSGSASKELLHFRLLPRESKILTHISDPFGNTVAGEFTLVEGEAQGEIRELKETAWVKLAIDATSYNSNLGLRDEDVRNGYLHVKDYPSIVFTSTGVEPIRAPDSTEEPFSLTVKGVLQLHGTKKGISLPVKLTYRKEKIIAEGSTKILLKDFNISVPTLLGFFRSGDQVEVTFRFTGERQANPSVGSKP